MHWGGLRIAGTFFLNGRKCVKMFRYYYYYYSTITLSYHIRTKEGAKCSTASHRKTGQKYGWKAKQQHRRSERSKLWFFFSFPGLTINAANFKAHQTFFLWQSFVADFFFCACLMWSIRCTDEAVGYISKTRSKNRPRKWNYSSATNLQFEVWYIIQGDILLISRIISRPSGLGYPSI